jgi:type II secretory pathway component PulM
MNLPNSVNNIAERIRGLLSGLTPRDRRTLLFGMTVVLLVGTWFAVNSMQKSTRQLNRNLEAAQNAQKEVEGMLADFRSRVGDADELEAKLQSGKDFTPLTWLEKVGNEMGISANIRSMTERGVIETDYYRAQKINILIDNINLQKTVDLLHRLESAPQAVRFDEVRLKTDRKEKSLLDVRIDISVLGPLEGT